MDAAAAVIVFDVHYDYERKWREEVHERCEKKVPEKVHKKIK